MSLPINTLSSSMDRSDGVAIVLCILLAGFSSVSKGSLQASYYTRSMVGLRRLAWADLAFSKEAISIRANKTIKDAQLQRAAAAYWRDFRRSNGLVMTKDDIKKVTSNPISIYLMMRRMVVLLGEFMQSSLDKVDIITTEINQHLAHGYPSEDDLKETIRSILVIQNAYNIKVVDLADGRMLGVETYRTLDAIHCYEIGRAALNFGEYFALAIEWLDFASLKILADDDRTVELSVVNETLTLAIAMHDAAFPIWRNSRAVFTRPVQESLTFGMRPRKIQEREHHLALINKRREAQGLEFEESCSAGNVQTNEEKSHLFCWLEFKMSKIFIIGPMKMEFLSRDPDIVQIYEVISSDGAMNLIRKAIPTMVHSQVVKFIAHGISDEGGLMTRSRTSMTTWITDELKQFPSLLSRIEQITGLKATNQSSAEFFQILSYVFGAQYIAHTDPLMTVQKTKDIGDRLATFMIYLTDVEAGGQTVFPRLGIQAEPVKSSAIFWFNMFGDETIDVETLHGGCPVVMGTKWVANKWIRFYDQFLVRKCSLNPKERFQVAVNGKYLPIPESLRHRYPEVDTLDNAVELGTAPIRKYSYSSVPGLKSMALLEWKIYKEITYALVATQHNDTSLDYAEDFLKHDSCIARYLADFGQNAYVPMMKLQEGQDEQEKFQRLTWNPIFAYRMVWRFKTYFEKWLTEPESDPDALFRKTVSRLARLYNISDGPTLHDLNDAMTALIMLHHVYDLAAEDIARGVIVGTDAGVTLQAVHCLEIGNYALKKGYFNLGVEWLETALNKVQLGGDRSLDLERIEINLNRAKLEHDEMHAKSEGWEPFFFVHPLRKVDGTPNRKTRKLEQYNAFKLRNETNFCEINYWGICQGKPHQDTVEKSKLFCWYESEVHPSWKIGPLKVELHSLHPKPEVVQYHNILSTETIKLLIHSSGENFQRATVAGATGIQDRRIDSHVRMSTTTWLLEKKFPISIKVSQLIERVTGLKVVGTSTDELQIATYTPGSHYSVHPDTDRYFVDGAAHTRIATFMFYLTEPQQGGETAFVQAGARVTPEVGSAVFWYNLYSDGELDSFTWHGACPVIFGEKWVANRWIHYDKQHQLQCHKTQPTRIEVLVNGKSKYK